MEAGVSTEGEEGRGTGVAIRAGTARRSRAADYEYKAGEITVTSHMQDFLDCTRTRAVPRCGVDRAFEEIATIMMSVESFKKGRKVHWDPSRKQSFERSCLCS